MQCSIFLAQQPVLYPTDESKILFVSSVLTGRALDWATAVWTNQGFTQFSFDSFMQSLIDVFDHPECGKSTGEQLLALRQGNRTAADYTLTFRTLATQTGWLECTLKLLFRQGLSADLQSELACRDEGVSLDQFISLAIRVDNLICFRRPARWLPQPTPAPQRQAAPEPMQLHRTHLTPEERERRLTKKDGSLRPCIDYCGLNDVTVKFRYPLPLVPAALEQLRSVKIYTKLDLRSAYNLVRIREGDEWKTAFSTTCGHYEYLVMPFGLSNSPSVFQSFVNDVFRDLLYRCLIVYINDILIYSNSLEEHIAHVRTALKRLIQHQLYAKAEKCEFHLKSVAFLGYVISLEGVAMDDRKVRAILEWPQPATVKELQRFLGFVNFYLRFIRNFSTVASPLTAMLKKGRTKLHWPANALQAFAQLKERFTSVPILHHPNPDLPFVVEVDASNTGIGAILSQSQGNPPKLFPCAYYSRKLSPAEQNYDVGNRELLAMKAALEEWRHWLEGARHPFQVLTDHRNLEYLRSAKRLNPRQARCALFFTRFDFNISYLPGSKNTKAESLSRQHETTVQNPTAEPVVSPTLFLAPVQWDLMSDISQAQVLVPPPPDCPTDQSFEPPSLRERALRWVHDFSSSGHPGISATTRLLSNRFWWGTLPEDTADFVKICPACNLVKSPKQPLAGLLQPLPIPQRPWSHIAMDFMTDLPNSQGHSTILTVIDRFSKACRLLPLPKLPTALETAEHLFQYVFRFYGLPEEIVSDRGTQFTSRVWKAFCRLLNVNLSLTSGYHPQSNGQTERLNQEIIRFLRMYCHHNQSDWSRFLPWAEYAQISLLKPSTKLTPFQCILGYQPPLFPWSGEPSEVPAVNDWLQRSEAVWDQTHVHLQRAVDCAKLQADRRHCPGPDYTPGQWVWLSIRDLRLPCRKLSPRYVGPFKILRKINPVSFHLELPTNYRISPSFHVSLLKPADDPGAEEEATLRPTPLIVGSEEAFLVRRLLDSRRHWGQMQYLVDWEGYGLEERSWSAPTTSSTLISSPSSIGPTRRNRPLNLGEDLGAGRIFASGAAHRRGALSRTPVKAPPPRGSGDRIHPSTDLVVYISL
ncbi:uncharacterized protein ccser2a isoform X1 [Xyrauchen texanus]|uniref:uncharacterized protein ccser2a isoform X1 n=1 Tax=Xyrauchen texanus TaxID=154827 RepID=UPI0022418FF4|nr:uncharacterized protein ccser2a isoform X1 [Xyrauchen texanus]